MSHTVSGQTTTDYTWDVAAGLPVVLQDGTNTYVYGLDLISATDGAGVQTYHLYDGLGSTTDLTDGVGNGVASYGYDVFGGIRSQSGTGDTMFRFTGEQRDADSGMYYLRARYYDPAIGRFLGQDPLPGGNRYAYVRNNPVNHVDPTGLQAAEAGTLVVLSCTVGAAGSGGTTCVVGVVAVTGAIVVIGVCVAGAPCGALGGAIVDTGGAIIEAGKSAIEGAGNLAEEVWGGITSPFRKGDNPYDPKYHEDPGVHGLELPKLTRQNLGQFVHSFCRSATSRVRMAICRGIQVGFAGVGGCIALNLSVPILLGEKPPCRF